MQNLNACVLQFLRDFSPKYPRSAPTHETSAYDGQIFTLQRRGCGENLSEICLPSRRRSISGERIIISLHEMFPELLKQVLMGKA